MKILLIGNGFDRAHGLPTQYKDFLDFCERITLVYELDESVELKEFTSKYLNNWDIHLEVKNTLAMCFYERRCIKNGDENRTDELSVKTNDLFDELFTHIKENAWINYFSQHINSVGENWINFESEISRVIQALDENRKLIEQGGPVYKKLIRNQGILLDMLNASIGKTLDIFKRIEDVDKYTRRLEMDLKRLTRAFEIYLAEIIEKIENSVTVPEIELLMPDHVLSFNYTNTYMKKYGVNKDITYDFVHGKANVSNDINTNNMVLGIDEYLLDDRRNNDIEFVAFKKYYQRIVKETGCLYVDWIDTLRKDLKKEEQHVSNMNRYFGIQDIKLKPAQISNISELYIFGHSLDVTDKDIIRELILNDNVRTTIFYLNEMIHADLVANLIKVIGQEELIKRTGGPTKTIVFKKLS